LTRLLRSILLAGLLLPSPWSFAQDVTEQFLPEVDVYRRFDSAWGLKFQAKNTKESSESTQVEIGPSLTYDVNRWRTVTNKLSIVSMSVGYRYLPSPNQPPTNRLEPVFTLNYEKNGRILLWDRNRGDLDWQEGGFTWRYRNRLNLGYKSYIHGYELTPYAAVEAFYESKYGKWSDTAIYAGCLFPMGKRFELDPYYEHQNSTGNKKHNEVYDQFGLVLRMYFNKR
jgi:Protein of unknown function (DUF2490)